MLYLLAHYLHLLGAFGLVVALAVEWLALARLRAADSAAQARAWLGLSAVQRRLGPASLAALLLGGVYMAASTWGAAAWIVSALLALVLIAALGAHNGVRLARLTGRPDALRVVRNPLFVASVHARAAILLGVVWLMVARPEDLRLALGLVLGAALLGAASAWPTQDSRLSPSMGASLGTSSSTSSSGSPPM